MRQVVGYLAARGTRTGSNRALSEWSDISLLEEGDLEMEFRTGCSLVKVCLKTARGPLDPTRKIPTKFFVEILSYSCFSHFIHEIIFWRVRPTSLSWIVFAFQRGRCVLGALTFSMDVEDKDAGRPVCSRYILISCCWWSVAIKVCNCFEMI
jgi:hypothetical protein